MQMSEAETDADIEAVLDKPESMAIVNCSKWTVTYTANNASNKSKLVTEACI